MEKIKVLNAELTNVDMNVCVYHDISEDEEGTYFFYYSLSPGFLPNTLSDSSFPLQSRTLCPVL